MSYLLVGDNRTNNNWGGRAGGLALSSLLRGALGPGRSVFGAELTLAAAGYGFQSRLFPASKTWLAQSLATRQTRNPLVVGVRWLDRCLGAGDFLADDPARSVRNLRDRMHRDPGLADLYERVAGAEVVVINGEGDVVFSRPVRRHIRFFAAMVQLARDLDRPVVWVNSILSDCSRTGRDPVAFSLVRTALQGCDLVTVRDRRSLQLARTEMGLDRVRLVPDALFHWFEAQARAREQLPADGDLVIAQPERERYLGRLDFAADYVCVGGNSCVTLPGERPRLVAGYRRLCARLQELGYPVYVIVSDGRDGFLEEVADELDLGVVPVSTPIHLAAAILGRARLLVSGRYHPTIMAALGGTPCIFLETGAHKMSSLTEILEYADESTFPAAPSAEDVAVIGDLAAERIAAGDPLRQQISAVAAARAREVAALGPMIAAKARETICE